MVDRHTNTHTETKSKYFDGHGRLSQSEESECTDILKAKNYIGLTNRCFEINDKEPSRKVCGVFGFCEV